MVGRRGANPEAVWRDLSSQGRIRATGEDRVRLLHAIASNDLEALEPRQGAYAFFLNPQGRIQADSHIFVAPDHLLIHCEPEASATLREHIEKYIIMDDVTLEDVAGRTSLLALAGRDSVRIAGRLGFAAPRDPMSFSSGGSGWCCRAPMDGVSMWVMVPSEAKAGLVDALTDLGVRRATDEQWRARRVAHWVPRFGVDFDSRNIPHETGQLHAVSFAKGCYTGQEIVERVRSRGRVRRTLVGIELSADRLPSDLEVRHGGLPVGTMTSATLSRDRPGTARGFAIVRAAASAPGAQVAVGGTVGQVRDVSRRGLS